MMNIAIDGPSGAGKSTLSRMLAKKLGYLYIDTGALYRAVGLYAVRKGVAGKDTAYARAVETLLPEIRLDLRHTQAGQRVLLNGEDVSEAVREPEISRAASRVSAIPAVRAFLLEQQRELARRHDVVMDGRDIGTVVLPDAQLKVFLTASPEDRARRRTAEMRQKGMPADYNQVLTDMIARDRRDRERAIAPLRPAPDAVSLDTTGLEIDESFARLCRIAGSVIK